ncbi:DUF927 domain-containing protein [Salinicola sp. LHM]|uniref:DUF927 domain-containing protein n=1 Tax=Salinicola sp. LHM TaxID=3065298 RepID=UPI002ACECC07|nr:DUF927 domain-containing protein [Salinicola sp. LHM]WQH33604.1 DUF927 domain-containing protein [Salinicola sp. LHM]
MSQRTQADLTQRFDTCKRAALGEMDRILAQWLPGGQTQKREYVVKNPTRDDSHAGSFSVNLDHGGWYDFATGDKGGDLVALVAYVEHCEQYAALQRMESFLGIEPPDHAGGHAASPPAARPPAKPASQPEPPEWEPVVPVPQAALASIPSAHPKHGEPWKRWRYLDSAGHLLMIVDRHHLPPALGQTKPSKVFSPLTWWRRTATGEGKWQRKGLPDPRPLLNLDRLAANPGAPVVVCEGEKSADAAADLMPEYVATCWPNGAQSASKADWTPLAGRNVVLWPDNDQAGIECMEALATRLQSVGVASVRLMRLDHFDRLADWDGEQAAFKEGGEWQEHDDAADLLGRAWSPLHLTALASQGVLFRDPPAPAKGKGKTKSSNQKGKRRAAAQHTPGFEVRDQGVYAIPEDGEPRRVCDRLNIIAQTRDERGHNWGLLVEFTDPDGIAKRWNIPAEALISEGAKDAISPLLSMGLKLDPKRPARLGKNDLISYLQGFAGSERARLVDRLGWHGEAYLLPSGSIGQSGEALEFVNHGAELPAIETAGTLADWQQHIGALCPGNDRLVLCVCAALAGPLLRVLGLESGGFHLYGDSSGGKTTHLQAAVSVYGAPKLVRSWRSTDNALESIAAAHSDGLLALDEIGMCSPRIIGETVYMLGNGTGKARANDRGNGKPVRHWRLLFLSTGEKTLEQHMDEANQMHRTGMDMRMLGVPADAGAGMGLFQELHGLAGPDKLSDALKASVAKYYGTPLVAWLDSLTQPDNLAHVVRTYAPTLARFEQETLPDKASGQAHRAASRFALAALAGELATDWGVTGWERYTAWGAAKTCFAAWLAERGGAGDQEGTKVLDALCHLVETHGDARFTRLGVNYQTDAHAPRTPNRLGWRRTEDPSTANDFIAVTTYFIPPATWGKDVWGRPGMPSARQANKVLKEHGVLQLDHEGKTSIKVPGLKVGGATRFYTFTDVDLYRARRAANDEQEQVA